MEDNFISKYISETCSTEMWKRFEISYMGGRMIEMWKEKKSIPFLSNPTEIFNWNVEEDFISEYISEICISVEDICKSMIFFSLQTIQKSSTSGNVEDNLISEYISEICSKWNLEMYQIESNCNLLISWERFNYKYQDFHKPTLEYGR